MIPQIILDRLDRVRRTEKSVRLAWGVGRSLALAVVALLAVGLLDWTIDLWVDTPGGLRALLLLAQLALWGAAAWLLVIRPFLAPWADRDVALWVEDRTPGLGHRLITAVQLNRPDADTKGMSAELMAAVTRQAEEQARAEDYAAKVDRRRWQASDRWLGAGVAIALLCAAAAPSTAGALLARAFLADVDIPRSVAIEPVELERVRPSGEETTLKFKVAAKDVADGWTGAVRVEPDGRGPDWYPLALESRAADGAIFAAKIPGGSVDFSYRARLRDGRTRRLARIDYEPRPVVQRIEATLILPAYVGLRPDNQPYERPLARGEVAGPKGASAKVFIKAQKAVVKAEIELLGRAEAADAAPSRRLPLTISGDGTEASGVFDLRADESTYRVHVEDKHGFANATPPKRGVNIVAAEPPRVTLLPERFSLPGEEGLSEDSELDGAPIPLGSAVRIAYYASHAYGLDRARLSYRVIKAAQAFAEAAPSTADWSRLPLGEVKETAESGPFDVRKGVFKNSGFRDQAEFHPLPTPDPMRVPGRLEGGGCFDFQTRAIPGLAAGDQVEFHIEVFARDPDLAGDPGRSETRLKAFVTQPQFVDWVLQTLRHESRIRQLETRQRGVFAPEGADR
ncbi:MAG TPA: hypothetical protein VF950_10935 [Planctomycetota bacterium]